MDVADLIISRVSVLPPDVYVVLDNRVYAGVALTRGASGEH